MTTTAHDISISREPHNGHRARCSCGWSSDCYAQLSDTQRAASVHLQRARRADIKELIAKSSIGAALDDIKKRGIDAHLVDLEREMNRRRTKKSTTKARRAAQRGRR